MARDTAPLVSIGAFTPVVSARSRWSVNDSVTTTVLDGAGCTQAATMTELPLNAAPALSSEVAWLVQTLIAALRSGITPFSSESEAARLRDATFSDLITAAAVVAAAPQDSATPGADILLYQRWLAVQAAVSPYVFAVSFNLGVALSGAGRRDAAAEAYRASLAARPHFAAAAINLGLCLEALGQPDAALDVWAAALQPTETRTALLNHRARLQEQRGELGAAESLLRESLLADPRQPDAIQHFAHIRQKTCSWPVLPADLPGLPHSELLDAAGPLGTLALTDDVVHQRNANARWIARKTQPTSHQLCRAEGYGHRRLRIGYMSSDFCRHAMSYLIAELLERHDRDRFEIYGFCSTLEDGSAIRRRILGGLDHVRLIRDCSDEAAARKIRDDEIDILIDLNGLTAGARLQILRWKPAPVQATYLGFIGPVPLPELDYILCDDTVIPPERAAEYAPTPLAIGPLFQANDTRREIAPPMSREQAGVPDGVFVFCCFSNHYKITPEMFAAWMTILRQVPRAVLWLNADSAIARANLAAQANAHSVAVDRLIFADRVDPARYMARLSCADLFLDTFPYNAGTIASDALRMGLPLLTLEGRSFASRMASRALAAIGAQSGIASDFDSYVAKAVTLARDPIAYTAFKACVTRDAWECTLGDIRAFTAGYESALVDAFHARTTTSPEFLNADLRMSA